MEILLKIEKTAKQRFDYLKKRKPVEGLLEMKGLELAFKFLDDTKEKLERGEPITRENINVIKESLTLAELGASINFRAIMDAIHS